jgi:hypothetical protein
MNGRAVVENAETVGGTEVEYAVQFRVSKPVPGEFTMPDAPVEESWMLDALLWSPNSKGVLAVSARITDCDADRSAGAADISLSGAARPGRLSMTIGETLTGTVITGFADKIESAEVAAAVSLAGVCSAAPFDRGLALVEVECAV